MLFLIFLNFGACVLEGSLLCTHCHQISYGSSKSNHSSHKLIPAWKGNGSNFRPLSSASFASFSCEGPATSATSSLSPASGTPCGVSTSIFSGSVAATALSRGSPPSVFSRDFSDVSDGSAVSNDTAAVDGAVGASEGGASERVASEGVADVSGVSEGSASEGVADVAGMSEGGASEEVASEGVAGVSEGVASEGGASKGVADVAGVSDGVVSLVVVDSDPSSTPASAAGFSTTD